MNIDYYDFYKGLLDFCLEDDGLIGNLFREIKRKLDGSLEGEWNHSNPVFGNVTWFFEEGLFLEMLYNFDEFKKIIDKFVRPLGFDEKVYSELLKFQLNAIKHPFEDGKEFGCDFDFLSYFKNIGSDENTVLEERKTDYIFKARTHYEDWPRFAKEIVWYGRRKGATLYTNDANMIEIK
jgi:hypothetical protein